MGPIRKIIFHQVDSVIRGHHASKKCWTPYVGETLTCCRERDNKYDDNAVAVLKIGKVVGHVPREQSVVFSRLIDRGQKITACVTGAR